MKLARLMPQALSLSKKYHLQCCQLWVKFEKQKLTFRQLQFLRNWYQFLEVFFIELNQLKTLIEREEKMRVCICVTQKTLVFTQYVFKRENMQKLHFSRQHLFLSKSIQCVQGAEIHFQQCVRERLSHFSLQESNKVVTKGK